MSTSILNKLTGLGIALITPFREDESIDFEALDRLIDHIVRGKADYIVVLGTTAETPALLPEEREAVIERVKQRVNGRLPLVLGCGGNCTAQVVKELKTRDFSGFSAILSVTPYYNKPSQEGIYQHYKAIAEASPVPVILYNVPGRTGVNMAAATTLRLARDCKNIVAVKEASGNMAQINAVIKDCPAGFAVISGDDGIAYPLLTTGAIGVISVIGNAFPEPFSRMVRLALKGEYADALKIHQRFTDLFDLLFVDGNPAGVKCILSEMGFIQNKLRLPLVPTRLSTMEKIHEVLTQLNIKI